MATEQPRMDATRRAERLKARVADLEREIEGVKPLAPARDRARARSRGVDAILVEALAETAANTNSQPALPGIQEGKGLAPVTLAVIAVGGYGREELSPRSDVDILFLLPGKESGAATHERALVERMLYQLWDSGLEIGHSVRTISECVAIGKKDVPARSSMLDHRFVAGDAALYREFARSLEKKLFRQDTSGFVTAKLLEIAKRRERWGRSVSRNEPNLKEGEGGLRDAHTALWIARAVWGIRDAGGLASEGVARREEIVEYEAAFETMLEARSALHRVAGRKEDRLAFERQPAVAIELGLVDGPSANATELFMQSLTRAMASVQRFLQLVVDRMPERFHKHALKRGALPKHEHDKGARAPKGYRLRKGRLVFADGKKAARSAARLIDVFAVAALENRALHPETRDLVRMHRDVIAAGRSKPDAVAAFWKLVLAPDADAMERALSEMNDLGALGSFLPEMEALYCRVQHDTYHVYTCDAHLVVAAANAPRLAGGRWAEGEALLTTVARELPKRTFVLGLFLHDIGKSEKGHTEVGLRMLPRIAEQVGLTETERADIHFLIAEHLTMSHVAQRRDPSDPQTITDFAAKMGTAARLKLLYALTFCDIAAVGPGTWTDWKGALLRDLYLRTLTALEAGHEAIAEDAARRAEAVRKQAREKFKGSRETFERFLHRLPPRYFATTDAEAVIDDYVLATQIEAKAPGLKVGARVVPARRATEITFQAPDRTGLFADFAGALAAAGLSIRTARIHTTRDGVAIDRFEVVGSDGGAVDLAALDRMVRDLLWVLTGKQTAAELLSKRKPPTYGKHAGSRKAPRVEIDNDASAAATVVDVYARDRLGLLYDIASAITRLKLDIQVAIVSTKVDQAADSFYVREVGGGKVVEPARLEALRNGLLERLE